MSQQNPITFPQAGSSQPDWLHGATSGASRQGGGATSSAGALAAHWQSALRPATVPLLPPPSFETETAAPGRATAMSTVGSAVLAQPAAPSPPAAAAATPAAKQSAPSQKADFHGALVVVLSITLALLILYLIAGPFGASVSALQPLHYFLVGLIHRG